MCSHKLKVLRRDLKDAADSAKSQAYNQCEKISVSEV